MSAPNEHLRTHVTRVGFDLQLTKRMMAQLVYLDIVAYEKGTSLRLDRNHVDAWLMSRHDVPSRRNLESRGLLVWHPERHIRGKEQPLYRFFTITRAGKLTIELLKEAGLYEELHDMWQAARQDSLEAVG